MCARLGRSCYDGNVVSPGVASPPMPSQWLAILPVVAHAPTTLLTGSGQKLDVAALLKFFDGEWPDVDARVDHRWTASAPRTASR